LFLTEEKGSENCRNGRLDLWKKGAVVDFQIDTAGWRVLDPHFNYWYDTALLCSKDRGRARAEKNRK
jgi:hypothetical protein